MIGKLSSCADEAILTGEGKSWRLAPSDFGIGGRYPVKEVFSAALDAWRGTACRPFPFQLPRTWEAILGDRARVHT
jgi:hypothetical protein